MSDEYQLRKDIDKIYQKTYDFEEDIWNIYTKDELDKFFDETYYDKSEIDVLIGSSGGSGDLSEYVKKSDVSFTVSLEDNGTIVFNLGIGEE